MAALLIAKLQAGSRQHPLAKAMLEYGKLLRTVHALRWFTGEAFRRRIGRQLNLGESLNDLCRFIFFAHRGTVRYPRHDDQTTQAHCHSLVVNACVLSTTGYLEDAIAAQRADGATPAWNEPELLDLHDRLMDLLEQGTRMRDEKTSRFCAGLLDLWPVLWNFTETAGVDPTNNPSAPSGSRCCCASAAEAPAPITATASSNGC